MGKKKLIIIVAAVLVVVAIGVGVGLGVGIVNGSGEKANFKANVMEGPLCPFAFDKDGGISKKYALRLINSLDELIDLCDEYNNPTFNKEHQYYNQFYNSNMSKKLREYKKGFFKNRSLIIYSTSVPDTSWSLDVNNVYADNDVLFLDVIETSQGVGFQLIAYWTIIVEVNKSISNGTNDIQVIKSNEKES